MVIVKKMYRSARDKKLFGLCGGLAETINVDATLLRILLIVVTIFTSGMIIPVYIIAGLVIPKEPPYYNGFGPGPGYGGGYGGYGNGYGTNGYGNNNYGSGYGQAPTGGPYRNPPHPPKPPWGTNPAQQPSDIPQQSNAQFDRMMDDLEKKALRKEIDELKAKLAKYEKGEI
ncbi:PspC domain-containing protein [Paenibacillus sp. NEAU-GSW1]|uniref:PspC domain-containing protein n=1 Tax=Paenibacillus sp. NEAU-GSW1 TaxID=2682486 RepID=UPI0012E2B552|nr:PspC domain-containing protein [Paenibacillus sp. NEAU-GSW1]MUT68669.1 PspC domain-containing protein [Paenibacillus sp. NEAU-GSW1]